jgi:hypothetical protein
MDCRCMSREKYQGAKAERCKPSSSHTTITLISLLAFLVPAAFVAGHASAAMSVGGCSHPKKTGLSIGRMAFSGGNGRQLSHDDTSNSSAVQLVDTG